MSKIHAGDKVHIKGNEWKTYTIKCIWAEKNKRTEVKLEGLDKWFSAHDLVKAR